MFISALLTLRLPDLPPLEESQTVDASAEGP